MTLFRPVGPKELALIAESDFRSFPPRLPEQPIFYPVLNREYAEKIARDWNAPSNTDGFAGFVTRFEIDDDYVRKFEVRTVGAKVHQELWVPAEELEEFNSYIRGRIAIEKAFYGDGFSGELDEVSNLPLSIARRLRRLELEEIDPRS